MRGAYIKKVESRVTRLREHFGEESRVRRMLFRAVPHITPRDASNRANDLIRLLDDVPQLIGEIHNLRTQRTALRKSLLEMQMQGRDVVLDPLGPEDDETPAWRDA